MRRSSIINKTVVFLLVSGLLVTAITNFINAGYLIGKYEDELHTSNRYIITSIRNEFEDLLKGFESTVDTVALMTAERFGGVPDVVPDMDGEEAFYEGLFTKYLIGEEAITDSLYIYFNPELDGQVHDVWITRQGNGRAMREVEVPLERYVSRDNMSWFYTPMETGRSQWLDPYYNRYNQHISSYVTPMFAGDVFLGIIGMYLELGDLKQRLESLNLYEGDMFWIYNRQGELIYHPYYGEGTPVEGMYESIEVNGTKGYELSGINGKDYYTYQSTVDNGWTFAYSIPKDILDDKVFGATRKVFLVLASAALVLAFIVMFFARRYRRIFSHIIESLNEVKKGNLSRRITSFSNDEIGIMAEAINESNDNLLRNINEKNLLAYYNSITRLPNRNSLSRDLGRILNRHSIGDVLLVYVDVDNFRGINELLGYNQGNTFVKKVADILKGHEDSHTRLYHTNVDEFVYLVNRGHEDSQIMSFTHDILDEFGKNYAIGFHQFFLTVSIGIARYDETIKTVSDFYRIADIAINEAKKAGRNKSFMYDESMYDRLIQFNMLERDFERALKNDEFVVYFQPQILSDTGRVVSAEALVRWAHPDKGLLYPDQFIEYAEKSGLIAVLGDLVLKKACDQVKMWHEQKVNDISIAINISQGQIMDDDFVIRTMKIIRESNLDPRYIEFEITETMLSGDSEDTMKKLNQLKDFGISISLDDFGTGYSSFNSIHELPIELLKIDKSLMDNVFKVKKTKVMLESIINLAHKLDLKVIAEGVEHEEQVAMLRSLNCDLIQGYFYSKPLEAMNFSEYCMDGHS